MGQQARCARLLLTAKCEMLMLVRDFKHKNPFLEMGYVHKLVGDCRA